MSNLQIGLAIAGGVILAGVVAHGAWNSRRNAPRQAKPEPAREPQADNDTVRDTPELYVRDTVVDEKAGTATFHVVLGGPDKGVAHTNLVSVDYQIGDDSASAGSEHPRVAGTLNAIGQVHYSQGNFKAALEHGLQ